MSLPFKALVLSVVPDLTISWFTAAYIFALAWAAGFRIVFVPAGIGVRETVLVLLFGMLVSDGQALTIALLARIWWMLAEAIYSVVSIIWLIQTTSFSQVFSWLRKNTEASDKGHVDPATT